MVAVIGTDMSAHVAKQLFPCQGREGIACLTWGCMLDMKCQKRNERVLCDGMGTHTAQIIRICRALGARMARGPSAAQ